jgi:hypothetical protein
LTQNGNSTWTWYFEGGDLSTRDCIVVRPTSGTSWLELTRKRVRRDPTGYLLTVQVIGTGAMAYRFYAEAMN